MNSSSKSCSQPQAFQPLGLEPLIDFIFGIMSRMVQTLQIDLASVNVTCKVRTGSRRRDAHAT